jgi:hypothetical protein
MEETETDNADVPKKNIDICSDTMLVEDTNSTPSFTQSTEEVIKYFFQCMLLYDNFYNLFLKIICFSSCK